MDKLALIVAILIGDISQKVISKWKGELEIVKNVKIHPSAYGTLLLEAAIFGHYYVGEKIKQHMNKEEKEIFSDALNKHIILIVSLLLDHENKKKNFEGHEKMIRELYEKFAPGKHNALANYQGDNILELFREALRQTFNGADNFKLKFINNSFKNRVLLKIVGAFIGSKSKHTEDIFLDEKIIYTLADSLFYEFSKLDYNELSKEAEETI